MLQKMEGELRHYRDVKMIGKLYITEDRRREVSYYR